MSEKYYPPPRSTQQQGSYSQDYQSHQLNSNVSSGKTLEKTTLNNNVIFGKFKTMNIVVLGFSIMFFGALFNNIANSFLLGKGAYDTMYFIGTFIIGTGALISSSAMMLGAQDLRGKWPTVAAILAGLILISVVII